ncbi:integrin alpha-X-like [Anolis carolinensis]|uniref:integrin alpha-X-like n=1 Tax=Anolis carolinensis TaxID=28377 RepID=UPI002F2B713F
MLTESHRGREVTGSMGHTSGKRWTLQVAFLLCFGPGFLPSSRALCFNIIDTDTPMIFPGDKANQFGYRVVPVRASGASWLLVSAPFSENHTGSLFRCSYHTEMCQRIDLNHHSGISLGLSLTADEETHSKIIACGPTWERRCGDINSLNGICYIMSNADQELKEIHPAAQECFNGVDAAILYDDSYSIRDENGDFSTMIDFLVKLMDSVREKDVQFAVVQYSTEHNLIFDFAMYNESRDKVNKTIHSFQRHKEKTFTPSAIRYVAEEIFTSRHGMRPDSKKILIVLTDGNSNDINTAFETANVAADRKNITRYAIGVGKEISKDELHTIASSGENVFQAENFNALHTLQRELQNKVFGIEGTSKNVTFSSFQKEFSQGGFSTLLTAEHVVSGTVGTYEWSGGLEEEVLTGPPQINFMNVSDKSSLYSYLGYSMALAHHGQRMFYIVGAPRYEHIGKVFAFEKQSRMLVGSVGGDQIGSYFGAELSVVDLNGNGHTDLILIGVPFYYNGTQGGLVEVCAFNETGGLSRLQILRGLPGNAFGRFGSALSSLGDITGDGLADVAVGAPLEGEEERGAIYIFLGEVGRLRDVHSQCIAAASLSPVLHFFGQSIQGRLDLSGDELTDLAVGALGSAVILRSRPVFTVILSLSFSPSPIPLDDPSCGSGKHLGIGPRGNLSICFTLKPISPKQNSGSLKECTAFIPVCPAP